MGGGHEVPQLIRKDAVQTAWFKKDNSFNTPKSQIYVRIVTSSGRVRRQAALSELYVEMVKDSLNEFTYLALLAGLHLSLSSNSRGLDIYIDGYNDRQGLLLNRICSALLTFALMIAFAT